MKRYKVQADRSIQKWERLIPLLWCEVSEVLIICLQDMERNNGVLKISADDPLILDLYKDIPFSKKICINRNTKFSFENPYLPYNSKTDRHLLDGLLSSHWQRKKRYPRLAELTINACKKASQLIESTKTKHQDTIVIPSPLFIVYSFLTDPDNPCTAAYALTACRNWLSHLLLVSPIIAKHTKKDLESSIIHLTEEELRSSMESFSNYARIGMRWPDKPTLNKLNKSSTPIKHSFVGSYLATRGFSLLWFSRNNGKVTTEEFCKMLPKRDQHEQAELMAADLLKAALFTLSPEYGQLPPTEEISNQLFGYPLPIRGMDVVFNGGLRPSSSGGLVMVVSGQAGAGKTSFSLALSNALIPFGTPTYYISLEETESDIRHKLNAMRSDYEKRLCITLDNEQLFNCVHIPAFSMGYKEFAEEMSTVIEPIISQSRKNRQLHAGTCPGVIVVDNLTVLNESEDETASQPIKYLEKIIAQCREANVVTILVTAQDLLTKYRLDYLADFVIDLRYEKLTEINDRPVRIFNLMKTRHQMARQGAHIFHMGSGKGFRIVPNMDSLMDRRRNIQLRLPDISKVIHALNFSKNESKNFLDIFSGSNILIHGYGSSGKAGLALRMLLTPAVTNKIQFKEIGGKDFSSIKYRQKILVLSFLYPSEYYEALVNEKRGGIIGLHETLTKIFPGLAKPVLKHLVLYPGFIGSQDLLNKFIMMLDTANLSGEPYTGVLIDGLHNVFLQYPRLQEADMVWAVLYNILRRYSLTVVSTFTNFSVNDHVIPNMAANGGNSSRHPDEHLMQKGMTPFLHALMKASDYYLVLQELTKHDNTKLYPLLVRSAIGQAVPSKVALWDRSGLQIDRYISVSDLSKDIEEQDK